MLYAVPMTNKQTFPVRLDVPFTDEEITENILWSGCFQYTWWADYQEIPGGIRISYCDPDDDTVPQQHKNVLFDDIRRVMSKICEYRPSAWDDVTIRIQGQTLPSGNAHAPLAKKQIMNGIRTGDWDIDSDGADEIMQIAVFGKVVYS